MGAIRAQVAAREGDAVNGLEPRLFVENGGAFSYEFSHKALSAGLLEGATPECRGPGQVVVYQRAQERLLMRAVRAARSALEGAGIADIGLLKNCRDGFGHVYGAQENYEATLCTGAWRFVHGLALCLLFPCVVLSACAAGCLVICLTLVVALTSLALGLLSFVLALVMSAVAPRVELHLRRVGRRISDFFDRDDELQGHLFRAAGALCWVFFWPLGSLYTLLLRAIAFRDIRRGATAFLASRCILSGAGTVGADGRSALSEKAASIQHLQRRSAAFRANAVFDTGNLLKAFLSPFGLEYRPFLSLFGRRQRLQLGYSDSNRADLAEYLKLGTTCLVLDMAEAGFLRDAPRLKSPVAALHALASDVTLNARVATSSGEQSALELQRHYLERARRFIALDEVPSLEALEVVRLWAECLEALAHDRAQLVGKLDWTTKLWLVDECAGRAPIDVKKKVDLKYHELEAGYFDQLVSTGVIASLVSDAEVERAIHEPPERSPAHLRGRLIQELSGEQDLEVGWRWVRVGRRWSGKVVRLDDYRR